MPYEDPRPALAEIDAARLATGLSDAGARLAWRYALSGLSSQFLERRPAGPPPRRVVIIASANVFTAPLPWLAWLSAWGVPVTLKPARGHRLAMEAVAAALRGVELRPWRGGDLEAEGEALADAEVVLAYGRAETLAVLAARRPPAVRMLGFGPRYGLVVGAPEPRAVARDLALYDSRGCMSPAAVLLPEDGPSTGHYADAMAEAEARWPRGGLDAAEGLALRARLALTRAAGGTASTGPGWAVLERPLDAFSPVALPRCLVLHRYRDVGEARAFVANAGFELGTLAIAAPGLADVLGLPRLDRRRRMTRPGHMQRPVAGRWHDGHDVIKTIWPGAGPKERV